MNTCKHCKQPIVEFTFKTGREWWHMPTADGTDNTTTRTCRDGSGRIALPWS